MRSGDFTNNEEFIEQEVANIRCEKNPKFKCEAWTNILSSGTDACDDSILRVSAAYGDDPNEVKVVLKAKTKKLGSNSDTNENKNPATNSLNNIIKPLRNLNGQLAEPLSLSSLFRAVLDINDKELYVSF